MCSGLLSECTLWVACLNRRLDLFSEGVVDIEKSRREVVGAPFTHKSISTPKHTFFQSSEFALEFDPAQSVAGSTATNSSTVVEVPCSFPLTCEKSSGFRSHADFVRRFRAIRNIILGERAFFTVVP